MTTGAGPVEQANRSSVFWPTVWLVVALVAIKASYVILSRFWTWATPKDYVSRLYLGWVAAISYADVLFALCFGIAGALLLLAVRDRPKAARRIFVVFVFLGGLCVLYAIVSRQVFSYYAAPLTYQLLTLGGEPSKMWSSLEPFVTVPAVMALVAAPLGYVFLTLLSSRFDSTSKPSRRRRVIKGSLVVVLLAFLILGRQFMVTQPSWFTAQDRHVADGPHGTLLLSVFTAFPGARANLGATDVRPEDVRELASTRVIPQQDQWQRLTVRAGLPRPRNVILIVLESVGAQYFSLYGNRLNTTPRMVAEQANAIVFDRYYAPVAWTAYSLIALVQSQRPPMERYNETSFRAAQLEGESLPEVLRKSGYQTAFMSAGDPDWAGGNFLEKNGFQQILLGGNLAEAKQISSWGTEDRFLFKGMLGWIEKHRDKPFFLMAWTDQTHNPYTIASDQSLVDVVPPTSGVRDDLRRYLSLVREADTQIGALLDSLRRQGLADSTLVVVTGDHGEAFGQLHGGAGHGFTVYDEEVRVPLMLWNPMIFPKGARSQVVGSHADLAPTILNVLGIPPPAGWHGRSLLDGGKPPRAYFFAAAWGEYLLGIRDENLKYIYDAREGRQELYDLSTDPDEQRNLASVDGARTRRLRERLAAWLQIQRDPEAVNRRR